MFASAPRLASFIVLAAIFSPGAVWAEVRTWTDATGKFKRVASFQRLDGDSVVLQTADDKEFKIPLDRLAAADQAYAKKAAATTPGDDPFQAVELASKPTAASDAPTRAATGDVRVVVAKGVGTTVEEAKKDAYREAVRQVVGAYVEGDTLTRNDELIEDKVLSLSGALVQKADVISDSITTSDGLTRLRVRAEVKITELMKSLAKINITTTAVRTSDLAAQVTTAMDQTQTTEAMLSDGRTWEAFPASFFSMAAVGQPKVVSTRGENATVEVMICISPDTEKYLAFARRMSVILAKLGGPSGTFTIDGKTPGGDPGRHKSNLDGLWEHTLISSDHRGNLADPEIAYAFPHKQREQLQGYFKDMGAQIATKSGCLVYCFNQNGDKSPPYGCGLYEVAEQWDAAIGRKRDEMMVVCLMTQANQAYNRTKWEWFACDQSLFPSGNESPWNRCIECEFAMCASGGREIASEIVPLTEGFGVSRADWEYYRQIVMLGPMWIEANGQAEQRSAYVPKFTFPRRIELSAEEAASITEVTCVVRPRVIRPE